MGSNTQVLFGSVSPLKYAALPQPSAGKQPQPNTLPVTSITANKHGQSQEKTQDGMKKATHKNAFLKESS